MNNHSGRIPDKFNETIMHLHLAGYTYRQIAEQLGFGWTKDAVRMRIKRMKKDDEF